MIKDRVLYPRSSCGCAGGRGPSAFATAVEWPKGYPDGLSGAAVGVGGPAAVAALDSTSGDGGEPPEFSTDRGIGCVVTSRHVEQVARDLEDFSVVRTVLAGAYL